MNWGPSIRAVATSLTVLALACAGLVTTAGVANAEQGLAESGSATYVVTDSGKPISVTQKITLTNQSPSTSTTFYYWDSYSLWLPNGGSNLKATSGGSTLSVRRTTEDGQQYADLAFPRRLLYGQSRTLTVTYTIAGSPPRSAGAGRVGKGYAAIEVFSPGDTGSASVEIVAPRWMAIDVGEKFEESSRGDNRVATVRGGGPRGLWSLLSLRHPSQSLTKQVKVDDHTFNVVAFPGDTAWVAHITTNLPRSLRELEKLTKQDWPSAKTTISEDFSRQVYGWDGTYQDGDINIAESLDTGLLTHELAHAWSNSGNFDERWLTEGVAQEMTTQVMATLKGKDQKHDTVKPTQKGAIPLTQWADSNDAATQTEDYTYPASWAAVHALVAGSTKVSKPDLFHALTANQTIYDASGEQLRHATGWQQVYDTFEVIGGNAKTRSIMTTWVTGPTVTSQLAARDTARKAYAAQEKVDGDWRLPSGVRKAMADWKFPDAERNLSLTRPLATQAATAQSAATKAGLDATGARTAYQQADDTTEYAAVAAQLTALGRQAKTYGELRADVDHANPLAALGGLIIRPADDLDRAKASIAKGDTAAGDVALKAADSATGRSTVLGGGLILGGLALLAALLFGIRSLVWRRSRHQTQTAEGELEAHPRQFEVD